MRKVLKVLPLIFILLTACGEAEEIIEPEPPKVYLHQQSAQTVWDDKTVGAITPCCAFESTADLLTIYPYFDSNLNVTVKRILISENGFWNTITKEYQGTDNFVTSEEYSYVTLNSGTTIGYFPIDAEYSYWVQSALPSGYVEAVLKALCR